MMKTYLPYQKKAELVSSPFTTPANVESLPNFRSEDAATLGKLIKGLHEHESYPAHSVQTGMNSTSISLTDSDNNLEIADLLALRLKETTSDINISNRATGTGVKRKSDGANPFSGKKTRVTGNSSRAQIVSRVVPDKAPGDDNEYLVITLSNGLRAVLVKRPMQDQNNPNADLLEALIEAKKIRKEKFLPPDFPIGLPLTNHPINRFMTQVVSNQAAHQSPNEATCVSPKKAFRTTPKDNMEASLAVVVNVGCTDDPDNCIGLAHFTEHMVHYGSEKHPDENTYWNFEFVCSSDSNAITENHTTTFYSTVPLTCMGKNMDLMANMLSRPAFKADMTLREVHAVDSEFHLKKHYDALRRWFLFQAAIQGHPLGRMGFGNGDTLMESSNIHDSLRNFHSQYYVATAMTLGFESTLAFAAQEELILNNFSNLPQGRRKILRETLPTKKEKTVSGKYFNMDYIMQGLCSFSSLWLVWPVPTDLLNKQGNKSISTLVRFLSDERPGGLAHYLDQQEYIWLMLCNSNLDYDLMDNKYSNFIVIDFFLTPEGEAQVSEIVQATYVYLNQLVNIPDPDSAFERAFAQIKSEEERNYTFQKTNTSMQGVSLAHSLAASLQRLPEKDILKTGSLSWKDAVYYPGEIASVINHLLQPANMIAIQTLPSETELRKYIPGEQVYLAPHTNAEYVKQNINKRFGELTPQHLASSAAKYNFDLSSLENNNLWELRVEPMHFGRITPHVLPAGGNSSSAKVIQAVHTGSELNNYLSFCVVSYLNSESKSSARNFALSLLWVTSVYLSLPSERRKNLLVNVDDSGIEIGVVDISEKWFSHMHSLNHQFLVKSVTEAKFKMAVTALLTLYDWEYATEPDFITQDLVHFMSCSHSGDVMSDALTHIKNLELNDLLQFSIGFKWKAMAVVVVGGNVSLQRANSLINEINKQAAEAAATTSSYSFERPSLLNYAQSLCTPAFKPIQTGERCIRAMSDLGYNFTVTVTNFYSMGSFNLPHYMLWRHSLLFFPMRAFQYLRMINQLGYSVVVYMPKLNQPIIFGVGVTATAANFTTCELDKHLDEFMLDYGNFLDSVDEHTFERVKQLRGLLYDQDSVKVKLADAQVWYKQHFGTLFSKTNDPCKLHKIGMGKISVQVVGKGAKSCHCYKCKGLGGWKRCGFWNHFQFAQGKGPLEEYFISDPREVRNGT